MGDEDFTVHPGTSDRLVERLQRQLDRLEQVKSVVANKELESALRDLRHDLEDLKIIAPHVFGPPHPRR
jgi:hypothetical protein